MATREHLARSQPKARTHRASVCAESRAKKSASWALGRTRSSVLGDHWDVSGPRARHMRTDDKNPFSVTLAMIRDPNVDGHAMAACVLEALEDRYLMEAEAEPEKLRARRDHLLLKEHDVEARQNRSLQAGENVIPACLEHMAILAEIVASSRALRIDA